MQRAFAVLFLLTLTACGTPIQQAPPNAPEAQAAAVNASGCARDGLWSTTAKAPTAKASVQKGKASWYGRANQGQKTASGETFDSNAPTAAHPTLPLGTQIDVTNLENGRETTLTVNDRGPKTKGRVLDVSKKGAEDLGFTADSTARVKIEPKPEAQAANPKKC